MNFATSVFTRVCRASWRLHTRVPLSPTARKVLRPIAYTTLFVSSYKLSENVFLDTANANISAKGEQVSQNNDVRTTLSLLRDYVCQEPIVLGLGGIYLGVYGLWLRAPPSVMSRHFTMTMDSIRRGRLHTLLTSAVSHQRRGHLLANTLGLVAFGPMVCEFIGRADFVSLCCGAAVVSNLMTVLPNFIRRKATANGALGASDCLHAITYVLVQKAAVEPLSKDNVPIWKVAHLYPYALVVVYEILGAVLQVVCDKKVWGIWRNRISYIGHASGILCGAVYYHFLAKEEPQNPGVYCRLRNDYKGANARTTDLSCTAD